jgi:hypothetical protein
MKDKNGLEISNSTVCHLTLLDGSKQLVLCTGYDFITYTPPRRYAEGDYLEVEAVPAAR